MTMRRGEYYSSDEVLYYKLMNGKWGLLVLSLFNFIIGLVTFGLCMWIRFDLDFREWVRELEWYSFWYCVYVIVVAMLFVICNALLHGYAVVSEATGILVITQFIFGVQIVISFVGAVCICVYGVEESRILTEQLKEVFLRLIYRKDYDSRATRILDKVQEYVGCCGAHGSQDYNSARKPVPKECRDPITGLEYTYGCAQQLAWWLEPWSATLAGICCALVLVNFIQIILTSRIVRKIRQYRRKTGNFGEDYD